MSDCGDEGAAFYPKAAALPAIFDDKQVVKMLAFGSATGFRTLEPVAEWLLGA
jgi:hypothetical protein